MKKSITFALTFAASAVMLGTASAALLSQAAPAQAAPASVARAAETIVINDLFTFNGEYGEVAAGGTVTMDQPFNNIGIGLPKYGLTFSSTTLNVTSDKGASYDVDLNTSMYDGEFSTTVYVQTETLNITESGVYTLHIPAGWVTDPSDGSTNAAAEFSWTFEYTGGGQQTDKTLTVKSLTVGDVDLMQTPSLATIGGGDKVAVDIEPIADAKMITLSFREVGVEGTIRECEIWASPDKEDIVNPETGHFETILYGSNVTKLVQGHQYEVVVTAYSSNNAADPSNFVWGPNTIEFAGTSEAYKFSDVEIVKTTPVSGSEITDNRQPVTIEFSAPNVELTRVFASTGGQGAVPFEMIEYATPNADKSIWTVAVPQSFWDASDSEYIFCFYAKDAKGNVIKGNEGEDADSFYMITLGAFLAWPKLDVAPATGMVEELNEFFVSDFQKRPINMSWNSQPYVINEEGETVANWDDETIKQYTADGVNLDDLTGDDYWSAVPVSLSFCLKNKITTPGKYTLIIPRSTFNMGEQYSSVSNGYMAIPYTVVPMVNVNVELVNFASTSVKVAQGGNAAVTLTPAADWKLAKLTLNDEDVTANVKENVYTIEKIAADSHLVATYEYAHEVEFITESGVVAVEGKDMKVYNDENNIVLEGVPAEANVKVYTVNGMHIASLTADNDIVKINCQKGQVYVIMVNGTAFKIQH